MVTVVKSEWHQVEKRYGIEIDADTLSEIYPDLNEDEIQAKLDGLESGDEDIDEVINDAWENDVDLDWDYLNDDDWWTDRKGGYDITYSVEDWEVREEYVPPVTHKCTKCKWEGSKFDADWIWPEVDVDLSDFDTDDLIEELENRGSGATEYGDGKEVLQIIYEKRRMGQDYQEELDQLIWLGLGKIV